MLIPRSSGRGARPRTRLGGALVAFLGILASLLVSLVVSASPASAIPAAVATTRTVSGFPRYYADQAGTRVEPCIDGSDPFCVLVANPPIFDSTQPTVWPTNFPDEFFYQITDSDIITTPGCAGTAPGKALMRVALEGTFANTTGIPTPGQQIVFGRVRFNVTSGLCPNTPYTFTYPYGSVTFTTDATGSLARKDGTTDVGCGAATIGGCDFTLALPSTVLTKFLRWDPAVAPAAPAGYLGDPAVLHPITGAPTGNNFFRITGGTTPALQTNLFTVSGKIAGPLQSAPETLDAGAQPINIPSTPRTITITNVGPAPLTVASVAVSPAGTPWTLNATTCAGTIAVDASCTATLTFAPTVVGPANASLVITHNQFRSPTTIPLVGSGTTAVVPDVSVAPITVDFGRVLVGTRAFPVGAVIKNNGPGTYNVNTTAIVDSVLGAVGDSAAFLPLVSNDCPATGLVAGTICTVMVSFQPTVQKPYAATLQINGAVGTTAVNLTAALEGVGGIATSSTGLDGLGPDGIGVGPFPTWYQDDRGVRLSQCINPADVNCIVLADPTFNPALPVAFPGNYPGEVFYYVTDSDQLTTPGCGAGSPPGKAAFRAATEQTFLNGTPVLADAMVFGRLRVFATGGLCPGQTYTFVHPYGTFTFTADAGGGLKRADGTQDVGCVPAPTVPCNFNDAVLSPVSDGYLRWDTTLPAPPAGYLGDAATLHTVAGAPYVEPGQSVPANYVKLLDSAGNIVAQTNLFTVMGKIDPTQTATRFQTVAPKAVAFGDQNTGTVSAAKTISVDSVGTTPMTVTGVTVTGANAADFTVATNTCGVQAVATRCSITVTFRPGAAGARTATLNIASNVTNTWTSAVPLSGNGIGVAPPAPVLSAAPATVAFGNQLVGATSAAQNITVTNTGTAPLTVSAVTVGGVNAADFAATNGCTLAVAPAATCTIAVTARPAASGARAGTVTITSDGGTATINLTATGVAPVLSAAPATLTFASQTVATTSAAQTVTVTNTGTAPLTVQAASVAGVNAADFTATNGCTVAVAPGATCTISVTFTPAAAGARTGTLTITSTGGSATVTLNGTGAAVAAPAISAAPAALTFAAQTVATTSVAQTITVTNTGTAPLTVSGVTVGGVNAADFAATNGCTLAVAPAATCTVTVRFTPAAAGARAGTLTIASNGGTATATLSGTGVAAAPILSAAPAALTFASTNIGVTTAAQTITVTNTGNAPLTVSGVTVGGVNAADFAATNTCIVAVAPAGTCTISVTFRPSAAGARSGSLAITSNGGNITAPLSGTGATPPVLLTSTPASLAFVNTNVNATSLLAVTIRNAGTGTSTVPAVSVAGVDAAMFTLTNGCTVALAPNAICTVTVGFRPTSVGAKNATLTVAVTGNSVVVPLTGTGIGQTLGLSATSVAFGNQTARITSANQTVTVTNTGTAPLTVFAPSISGTNIGDFAFTNACPLTAIAAGATCTITVRFTPTALGARSATLNVFSNALNGSPLTVALTGTGITSTLNPSFETPALANGASQLNPVGTSWTFTNASLAANGNGFFSGVAAAPDGRQVAVLQNNNSRISQTMTLTTTSVLTFRAVQGRQGLLPPNQTLGVFVDGVLKGTIVPQASTFGTYSVALTSTAGAHLVEIRGTGLPLLILGPPTALVDNVALA